jgi:hypothetical protein
VYLLTFYFSLSFLQWAQHACLGNNASKKRMLLLTRYLSLFCFTSTYKKMTTTVVCVIFFWAQSAFVCRLLLDSLTRGLPLSAFFFLLFLNERMCGQIWWIYDTLILKPNLKANDIKKPEDQSYCGYSDRPSSRSVKINRST